MKTMAVSIVYQFTIIVNTSENKRKLPVFGGVDISPFIR